MKGNKDTAKRIANAEERFIQAVMDQFDKTYKESEKVLEVFKQVDAVRIDPIGGQFSLTAGIYWDKQVIDNALSYDLTIEGKQL